MNTLRTYLPNRATLHRVRNSIRTRYALATGFFLLLILAVFYIGGRIVLVHLVKDAEQQVREIGTDINRIALRSADHIRRHVEELSSEDFGRPLTSFLGVHKAVNVACALRLDADGQFLAGVTAGTNAPLPLTAADVAGYTRHLAEWAASLARREVGTGGRGEHLAAGILHMRDHSCYCAITRGRDGTFLVLGTPFSSRAFTDQVNAAFAGMEMRVTNRTAPVAAVPMAITARAAKKNAGGGDGKGRSVLIPLVSEALNFYSGGFWKLGENPFEAVYTIRDIAGNPVSMIAVSLPKTFSNAAGLAIGRLTFFVTMIGIVLVLPVFWFQSHLLLNPLSRMTECVQRARELCGQADCPRLDWKGSDEFAELAFSVNALLETITNRTLAIAEVESRQKALINGLPDGLLVFDREHRLVSVIKQLDGVDAMPGLTETSPIDVTLYGRDGVEAFGKAVDAVLAHGRPQTLVLEAGTRPHTRWFDVRISPMAKLFVLAIVRDITESVIDRNRRRAAETRLQHVHKQESLSLLAGSIAHDVNNVLSSILNTVEIAAHKCTSATAQEVLATVREAVHRGSLMGQELMTYAGEMKINLRQVDFAKFMRDTRPVLNGVVGPNVSIRYDLPDDLPPVDADADQLWKVFFNLVKNASEAQDGVGEIRVRARRYEMTDDLAVYFFSSKPLPAGPGVLVTVSDDGPGIPKGMMRRVFDPYVSTKASGRGFGLATVNTIIDAHHGGVRVESQPDRGTTFGVFLPASRLVIVRPAPQVRMVGEPVPFEGERAARPKPAKAEKPHGPTVREILLVDDDAAILKTTAILLQTLGFTVHTARGQADALTTVHRRAGHLTCILLDAHLGATDSVRLLATCRAAAPGVRIVVTSGSTEETARELFAEQPFDAFLAKPYSLADLQETLHA